MAVHIEPLKAVQNPIKRRPATESQRGMIVATLLLVPRRMRAHPIHELGIDSQVDGTQFGLLIFGHRATADHDAVALVEEVHGQSYLKALAECQQRNLSPMTNLNVFVGYRGDRLVLEARGATTPDALSRLNQRVQQGNGILKAWAEGHGGRMLAVMGDGGRLEISADHLHELPQIIEQYTSEVESPLSVGVGKELAQCEQALDFAVKKGGDTIEFWTPELVQELASLSDGDGADNRLFESYLNKAEPPLNTPAAGGGMTGPSQSGASTPTPPAGEASEHSENEALQGMLESQPPPQDIAGEFGQLAEQSEGAEQQQQQAQQQQQQQGEESDNVRDAIVNVLKDFKSQSQLWEQLKEAQPKAYKTMTGVLQAMIALARQAYGEGGGEQKEEPTQKSEAPLVSPLAPAMHATVEGFLTQLKNLPKVGPERGKLITSHMNHGPFLSALQTHPQGKQVHAMLTQFLNSKANAGIGVGAHAMAKKDLMAGETPQYAPASPENFESAISGADQSQLENPRDYSNKRLWLAHDGNSGYGITHDGELVNVFALIRGHGSHAVKHAITQGATHLSAFDGHLPGFYSRFGFQEAAREPNWTAGGPDVVKMKLPVAKKGSLSMIHHALRAGKTGRHQVVLPVGSQIDGAPSGNHKAGQIKVADPATGQSKWRSVRAGQVMAPDGTPTSSRNPSGGQ